VQRLVRPLLYIPNSDQNHTGEFFKTSDVLLRLAIHFLHDNGQVSTARIQYGYFVIVKVSAKVYEGLNAPRRKGIERRYADAGDLLTCHSFGEGNRAMLAPKVHDRRQVFFSRHRREPCGRTLGLAAWAACQEVEARKTRVAAPVSFSR